MNGFYVNGIKRNNTTVKTIPNNQNRLTEAKTVEDETSSASIDNSIIILKSENHDIFNQPVIEGCDNIVLKNGDEIKGKVTEIGLQEIKYKKCDNLDGPSISILKSDVFMIKYANGTKDIINKIGSNNDNNSSSQQTGNSSGGSNKTEIKKTYYSPAEGGGLMSESPLTDGKLNGVYKMYYKSGTIMTETPYVDNIANGVSKTYGENGKLMSEVPFVDGKVNGDSKVYGDKGQIVAQTTYVNGQATGKTVLPEVDKINNDAKIYKKWSIFRVLNLVFLILCIVVFAIDGFAFNFASIPLFILWAIFFCFALLFKILHKKWIKKQLENQKQ
ncbi:MAG: toxin-antitoxin system YwqK family antitoxin [Bacteroidetes bacterium]|nr:toxin-antitoxin system YwqK family antitoxin [Bacteroidota bacterium]